MRNELAIATIMALLLCFCPAFAHAVDEERCGQSAQENISAAKKALASSRVTASSEALACLIEAVVKIEVTQRQLGLSGDPAMPGLQIPGAASKKDAQ